MTQHINKDDLKKIIKKIIKESVGIPSEENYYISVMVPRIKSWMDEVYQDWGGINAVSPEALTDFSNRNDYEESLDAFAHEFNVDREELRPAFDKAIEIAHSKLKEDLLGEAKFVNQFTPYTDDEKRTNFEYLKTGFGRSPEERNPSYAAAKKAAEERRKQKEAQKQNGEVSETIRYESKKRVKKSEIVEAIKEVINNQTLNCNRNMNKKQVRLTESDLKQIVKESVNKIISEAYGTPDNATQSKVDYLRTNNFEKGDEMQKVWSEVRNALFNLKSRAKWLIGYPYEEAIVKATDGYEKKLNSIFKIWSNKLIQINGEQPDAKYNERHNGGDIPSVGWTRGPESYFTRGY